MKKVILSLLLSFTAIFMSACGGGDGESDSSSTSIVHNGTTYKTVTSPYTGRVWLDRNLGASRVCTAVDDDLCYGDYYQWGRNFDGHQELNSATTSTQATDVDNVGSSYIVSSVTYGYDWAQAADENGTQRVLNWSKTDGSNVCPVGFRVPTLDEFTAERDSATPPMQNGTDAFESFLKLSQTGYEYAEDRSMSLVGNEAEMWVNTKEDGQYPSHIGFSATGFYTSTELAASGLPVRCIKDNEAPTWTASSYDTGLTITDASDAEQIIKDLTAVSSDADGDPITYSIVSISVPSEQMSWNNSVVIESGVLKVKNLMTNDAETNGNVVVTVRATATGGSSDTTVSFTFNNVQ